MATKKEEQEARAAEAAQARVEKIRAELAAAEAKATELVTRKQRAGIERAERLRGIVATKRAQIEGLLEQIEKNEAEIEELDPSTPAQVELDIDEATDKEDDKPMALDPSTSATTKRRKR